MTQVYVSVGITDQHGRSVILSNRTSANYQPDTQTEVQAAKTVRKHVARFIVPRFSKKPAKLFWGIFDDVDPQTKPRKTSANYPKDLA